MKDIKEKVRDYTPKIRNPASRLPKELVRSAMLETKEKSRMVGDHVVRETGEESPVEYLFMGVRHRQRKGIQEPEKALKSSRKQSGISRKQENGR